MKLNSITSQYKGVWRILGRYWRAYGGTRALISTPYSHVSLLLTFVMYPKWSEPGWWDTVIAVMPNIIGFSLGGYAILIALGDQRFKAILSSRDPPDETSPYMAVNAAFVHFILVQILALILALIGNAYSFALTDRNVMAKVIDGVGLSTSYVINTFQFIGGLIGYWVFIYALMAAVAATFSILRMTTWYEHYLSRDIEKKSEQHQTKKDSSSPP